LELELEPMMEPMMELEPMMEPMMELEPMMKPMMELEPMMMVRRVPNSWFSFLAYDLFLAFL
jgi:hypothetical protein